TPRHFLRQLQPCVGREPREAGCRSSGGVVPLPAVRGVHALLSRGGDGGAFGPLLVLVPALGVARGLNDPRGVQGIVCTVDAGGLAGACLRRLLPALAPAFFSRLDLPSQPLEPSRSP